MKILIHSNAPWAGSGYGVQVQLLLKWLLVIFPDAEIIMSAWYGLQGAPLEMGKIRILPSSRAEYGVDILEAHVSHYKPDVVFMLGDIWVVPEQVLRAIPLAVWTPIDHTPMPPLVASRLLACKHPVAMSRHGKQEMERIGLKPDYVPHMVDTDEFKPIDRKQARQDMSIVDENTYVVVMVAANKGYPPRKNHDRVLKAWSLFIKEHPNSLLLYHSDPIAPGGLNLENIRQFYQIPDANIRFPDLYTLTMGRYGSSYMNKLYNAADVFLLPSAGEGFGIPALEAQAAGCPVIVSDFTAQSELCGSGYKIPIDPIDDTLITLQYSEQCLPKVSEIVKGIEWGLTQRGNETLRNQARTFAMDYDAVKVMRDYVEPLFKKLAGQGAAELEAVKAAREARAAKRAAALKKSVAEVASVG